MIIELKTCTSEPHAVHKTLASLMDLEGFLREESPISNPSIMIESTLPIASNIVQANYAYIPAFARYYYITEITHIRTHLWRLDMKCDVLMSFASSIGESTAIVEETSLVGQQRSNEYVPNDSFATLVKDKTDIIQFSNGFSDTPYFILITAGGVVS